MNYTDFGVNGPEEFEQDGWSITKPTFETPKGGVLTVVGIAGRQKSGVKCYAVHCSKCRRDRDLFGDGVFASQKTNLKNGSTPCGCSFNPKWSEEQQAVRVNRYAGKRGYIFTGWAEEFNGNKTKCRFICPDHGQWESTDLANILTSRYGCPSCAGNVKLTQEMFIEKSLERHGDTYDYRLVKGFYNNACKIEIVCKKHGPFLQRVGKHIQGAGCPSCGNEKTANKIVKREDAFIDESNKKHNHQYDYSKVRYNSACVKVEIICKNHGAFYQTPANHLRGHGCPSCAGRMQRQAYVHAVWDRAVVLAIKFGIAKDWADRLKDLNRKNVLELRNIGVWVFTTVKSCRLAELECKQTLKTGVLSSREMKDGWTETVPVLDIDNVIAIYEKHGGKRIREIV